MWLLFKPTLARDFRTLSAGEILPRTQNAVLQFCARMYANITALT
jgi:hypothetical protein